MRYMIGCQNAETETALALYRTTLTWAASYSDSFELDLQVNAYDDPDEVRHLCALGQATAISDFKPQRSALDQLFTRLFRKPANSIQVKGTPDATFIRELTSKAAPANAVAGDVSPVEDLKLFSKGRLLYGSYDYGRAQVLDLTNEEYEELRQALEQAGLDPECLVLAPPYITERS
jgi:hypothetical protein